MISKTIVKAIVFKEYKHITRDPFTMIMALVVPLILVLFFGFIVDLDYKHIKVSIQDNDNSQMSRRFIDIFKSCPYFEINKINSMLEIEDRLLKNNTPAILIIKEDFAKNIVKGNSGKVQLLLDGSDNAKTGILSSYLSGIALNANAIYAKKLNMQIESPEQFIRTHFLFNTELNSRWFIVPGLSTIIIGLIAIILMSLTIAKEWENGSMELLLSTPVKPIEVVIGKIIPYFVLNMLSILTIFIISLLIFKIPFEGNFFIYIFACVIYVIGALSLGTFISVVTRQQQAAVQFAFAIGLLPSFLFSGFIFSIENMPALFRYFTAVFPQRWFMEISRTLFLSKVNFKALTVPFLAIIVFAILMIMLASIKLKTDLEP
ncbi:MAG: ABC transporter permease [Endomicrobium sp.]|jgi:ABC-2 type transport system permease protein|uniref:ABC transporter permease n=1 Tax=Candidatus Endomicrobiellum cubanum TaxID=3242325 RepID=UPI00282A3BD0|nr:ABC transporter permease [Endomicrobium sp.]